MINKLNSLTPETVKIIKHKGTELPNTGKYNRTTQNGTYLCRCCGLALFHSDQKFISSCGWPSFDDEISGNILRKPDVDGRRTEIVCSRCHAHLGHVFTGEYLTEKNLRHCVNSLSIDFVNSTDIKDSEEIIVAGGCFWGIEYYMKRVEGVVLTEVGYSGGNTINPSYEQVCRHQTDHLEATRIIFDTALTNLETVLKVFFEIHDPTQTNGQGPDLGEQYLSACFYYDTIQKNVIEKLILDLEKNGFEVATKIAPVSIFWPAESYHQEYYDNKGTLPYCHRRIQRF